MSRVETVAPVVPIRPSRRPVLVAAAVAAVLAVAYLLAPPTGEDLSAQLFRASFARTHPLTPVDFQWFGGTMTFGYSLWAPLVMTWLGVGLCGAVCSVVATVQTTTLLQRGGARRPLVGGVLAALTQSLNLVEGRTSFSLGMICGLGALLLIASPSGLRASLSGGRWTGVVCLAVLCATGSPVAALLLWVAAAALVLTGSVRRGVVLLAASLPPVLAMNAWFGEGGVQSFSGRALIDGVIATSVVAIAVSKPLVRFGALVGVVMLVASYLVASPVGDNSLRLSLLFAIPVVGAFVAWRPWLAVVAVGLTAFPQQLGATFAFTDGPSAHAAYYSPLLQEIDSRGPLSGRVEIPETMAHWDAWYVGRSVPLARGWLRQVDLRLNDRALFSSHFSPAAYRSFLERDAVEYVAVPDAPVTVSGTQERAAVLHGLPYLHRVWGNAHWSLWKVERAVPIVAAPGRLVAHSPATVTVQAPADATMTISLRWLRWLDVSPGACIEPGVDGQVVLHTTAAGRYVIGSRLVDPSATHCSTGAG